MARSVVAITFAPPGEGKTFSRCGRFLWREWLPSGNGVHYSNFPIRLDPWKVLDAEGKVVQSGPGLVALAREKLGMAEAETRRRVQVIPPEELDRWRVGT